MPSAFFINITFFFCLHLYTCTAINKPLPLTLSYFHAAVGKNFLFSMNFSIEGIIFFPTIHMWSKNRKQHRKLNMIYFNSVHSKTIKCNQELQTKTLFGLLTYFRQNGNLSTAHTNPAKPWQVFLTSTTILCKLTLYLIQS